MIIALLTDLARSHPAGATPPQGPWRELRALSDYMLRDIGIERHQIAAAVEQMVTLEGAAPRAPEGRFEEAILRQAEFRGIWNVSAPRNAA